MTSGKTMIVQRVFHHVKPGRGGDFLALVASMPASLLRQAAVRTYTASIGRPASTVCHEFEFADLDELDRVWAAWWADPATPNYMAAYWRLVDTQYSEVWYLEN
jgi:hypothetical protein